MKKAKIAVIHPKIGFGGSEATVLFMIETLKDNYEVSLVTSRGIDLGRLNNHYGTDLNEGDFRLITAPMPGWLAKTDKFSALRGRFIQRYCQKISSGFDLLVSAYNPMDFKRDGIQFATDIAELPEIISLKGWKKWFYGKTLLRRTYLKICDFISQENIEEWKENKTFSNSYWTKSLLKERYGIDSEVIYPPVQSGSFNSFNQKRESGFLIIGRIVPEKQFERAVQILKKVRERGHNVHLHIIGSAGDRKYRSRLFKNFISGNSDWVFFEGMISEERKKEFLFSHLFGISCRSNEPFGIAAAEMAGAGCIVFVPDGGGQTEVAADSRLIYGNVDDAAEKIEAMMKDEEMQNEIREKLAENSRHFSVEIFKKEIVKMVENHLSKL